MKSRREITVAQLCNFHSDVSWECGGSTPLFFGVRRLVGALVSGGSTPLFFGVRRLVGALVSGGLAPLWPAK
jgi:hypothetical protein